MRSGISHPLILKPHAQIFEAKEVVRDIRIAFDNIKDTIWYAQNKPKRNGNKHRNNSKFKKDEWVFSKFLKGVVVKNNW